MREKPIICSGPMVRAILDGRKTQTRRVVKWNNHAGVNLNFSGLSLDSSAPGRAELYTRDGDARWQERANAACRYGKPGDRLWVRETWARYEPYPSGECVTKGLLELPQVDVRNDEVLFDYWAQRIVYRADFDRPSPCELPDKGQYDERWRSPIFMPRWASRITREITEVRVQRLQEIGEADAIAEGFEPCRSGNPGNGGVFDWYRALWESINGLGSWDANPWVWAVSFRPIPTAISEVQA